MSDNDAIVSQKIYNIEKAMSRNTKDTPGHIGTAFSAFQMIPELRGLWPHSGVDENGAVRDFSGQARSLTNTGTAPRSVTGTVPYVSYNGTTQYLSRATEAGLSITGALTWGGWFYFNAVAVGACMTKYTAAGNLRAYWLGQIAGGIARSHVSTDGIASINCDSPASSLAAATWYFLVGRFTPSTELAVFYNGAKSTNVVGIPATVFVSTAALMIGGASAAASLAGRSTMCFLSAAALSDRIINNLFNQSRTFFGV